jgi:hypothetical protein
MTDIGTPRIPTIGDPFSEIVVQTTRGEISLGLYIGRNICEILRAVEALQVATASPAI